jgi:hypothetical protein
MEGDPSVRNYLSKLTEKIFILSILTEFLMGEIQLTRLNRKKKKAAFRQSNGNDPKWLRRPSSHLLSGSFSKDASERQPPHTHPGLQNRRARHRGRSELLGQQWLRPRLVTLTR